jgi:hypothetical protein
MGRLDFNPMAMYAEDLLLFCPTNSMGAGEYATRLGLPRQWIHDPVSIV